MADTEKKPFNPNEHLTQLQKKDYLEVKWRLVWFRDLFPHGTVETEILQLDLDREVSAEVLVWNDQTRRKEKVVKTEKGFCVCRAVVKDGSGGVGTGTKSEAAVNFGDFIEKAETGAIGRALAVLGFGTQFTGDELDEHHRIVDSPVDRNEQPATPAARPAQSAPTNERKPAQEAPKPQAAIPASNGKQNFIPNFAQMRNLAIRYYPDGWLGLRSDMIIAHDLGDIGDEDWSEDLRKLAYARIQEAKESGLTTASKAS